MLGLFPNNVTVVDAILLQLRAASRETNSGKKTQVLAGQNWVVVLFQQTHSQVKLPQTQYLNRGCCNLLALM